VDDSGADTKKSARAKRREVLDRPLVAQQELSAEPPWCNAVKASWDAESVIALLEPMTLERRRERILEIARQRIGSVTVVMDETHDPHNGAAILRTCDAFGIQEAHVVPRDLDEGFRVGERVAQGTQRWVDVVQHASSAEAAAALIERGFELVATHPEGELTPEDLAQIPKLALVMGNERDGISAALTAAASRSVRIPMRGFVESLNVSVSAALLLRAATRDRPGDLSEAAQRMLYAKGLFHTVPRAPEILAASQK
jgi:tRNA (guanosine-2'-O-)-methyltransferase